MAKKGPSSYDQVLSLLRKNPELRNDDKALRWAYLEGLGLVVDIPLYGRMLSEYAESKAPSFETIRRSRQKVQANHPELGPTDPEVVQKRKKKEATKGTFIYREPANPAAFPGGIFK